jgi:uncharacterized protein YqfA (UPF0365 family)
MLNHIIDYTVIGTHPEVEVISLIGFEPLVAAHKAGLDQTDTIVKIAEHHYGLTLANFDTVDALIDTIRSMDDQLQHA